MRSDFESQGYAIVRGLLTPDEVAVLAAGFDALLQTARTLGDTSVVDGSSFVLDADPFRLRRVVWCGVAEPSLRLGGDPRFLCIARAALGTNDVVQLIQQAHFKLPGDEVDFAWHQDASNRRYGSPEWTDTNGRGSFVQIALAIDPMNAENGGLSVLPASHRAGFVAHPKTGALPGDLDLDTAVTPSLNPGDALIFGPFLIHGSGPNRSPAPRRLFLQGYASPGANRRVYPGCGTGVLRVLSS